MNINIKKNIKLSIIQELVLNNYIEKIKENGITSDEKEYLKLTNDTTVRTTEAIEVFVTNKNMQTLCFAKKIKCDENFNILEFDLSNFEIVDY